MTNIKNKTVLKLIPLGVISLIAIVFIISVIKAKIIIKKSEKELNPKKQSTEAEAGRYTLEEIDTKTGKLRWKITAKGGRTEEGLQAALIKDISAEVFKDNKAIFELKAPYAKANASTKEIYLYGDVIAKNKEETFLLKSKQIALGMGTSIEAQKGFNLILKDSGTVTGTNALINDDQTKIEVTGLKEATFKDIRLSGEKVLIEKDKNGELLKAIIKKNGKIVLKNNNTLLAENITWEKNGEVEAKNNVIYTSSDKTFKANYIMLKENKKIYAKDSVLIQHGKTKCYGNSLTFEDESNIFITGKPKAIQGNKQITADKIVYNITTGKVEALGNVRTIVVQNNAGNKT